jgi:outer membrane scaffolding protein for murein synthesis (MipA/OmpV family)
MDKCGIMRDRRPALGIAVAGLLFASTALASDIEEAAAPVFDWSLSIGIGGGLAPDYEGSDDYKAIPLPLFDLRYEGLSLRTSRFGIEADIVPGEAFQAGPILRYNTGRDGDVKDEIVRLLPEIGGAAELGAFAATGLPLSVIGIDSPSIVTARAGFVQGLAGGHEGLTIESSLGLVTPVSEQLTIIGSLSATYMSDKYADSFFGVTPVASAASGLAVFDPGSGIKDFGVTLVGNYKVSDAWSATGIASYTRLLGDAADSPIVSERGSANQIFGGLGISYKLR